MHSEENQAFYESSVRFDADRIQAAAVYCSDGRFGEQFDDTQRLHISPLRLKSQQLEDMKKAVQRVRSIGPNLLVDAFFARTTQNGAVQFESNDP